MKTAFKATAELYGKNMSEVAATMLISDLRGFTPGQILQALEKCRKELKTFPTVADITARINDGRPGTEEAWAMIPKDEDASIVWTDEMAEAFGPARTLLLEGDPIAARMAFKEVYPRLVADARARKKKVNWWLSAGHSPSQRDDAVEEAIARGRLTAEEGQKLLGHDPLPKSGKGGLAALSDSVSRIALDKLP